MLMHIRIVCMKKNQRILLYVIDSYNCLTLLLASPVYSLALCCLAPCTVLFECLYLHAVITPWTFLSFTVWPFTNWLFTVWPFTVWLVVFYRKYFDDVLVHPVYSLTHELFDPMNCLGWPVGKWEDGWSWAY